MNRTHVKVAGIMLASIALSAYQTVMGESSDRASGPDVAEVVRIKTGNGTPPFDGEKVEWFAANTALDQVQFRCVDYEYLERQFDVEIIDDIDGNVAHPRCRTLTLEADAENFRLPHAGEKRVHWIVIPYFAKIQRKVEYIYSQRDDLDKVKVRSRPIMRVHVLATDQRTGSCASADISMTRHWTHFDLKLDIDADRNSVIRSSNHDKEEYLPQFRLSKIHERASPILVTWPQDDCKAIDSIRLQGQVFHEFMAALISPPERVLERRDSAIQSWLPEMDSVVRVRTCRNTNCSNGVVGSGFYIEDAGKEEEVLGPDTSTLILTNHHIVKNTDGGMVHVSTLQLQNELGGGSFEQPDRGYFHGVVVFQDERLDLALVRVPHQHFGIPLRLHSQAILSSDNYQVMALGHPTLGRHPITGSSESALYSITTGSISRIVLDCGPTGAMGPPVKCIQHDAATNAGSSGGPLLSLVNGRGGPVLGVNFKVAAQRWRDISRKLNPSLTEQHLRDIDASFEDIVYPGMSLAIHYEEVQMFLNDFLESSLLEPND